MKRVVITGMGVISPIGNNLEETWEGIKEKNVELMKLLYLMLKILK